MMHLLARHHGRHASVPADPFADATDAMDESATEVLATVPEAPPWILTETQPFPAPGPFRLPRFIRRPRSRGEALLDRPLYLPGGPPSPSRGVVARERSVIADSMGQFTVDCYFCDTQHHNAQAGSFPLLRRYAWDKGWRLDIFGRWACPRDVRSNPLFIPLMQLAERITCRKCGEVIRIIDGDWAMRDGTTGCYTDSTEPYSPREPHEPAMAETAVAA